MADLIAIGYPDTTTALQAEEEVQRLAQDLVIQPDAVAAIIRNQNGHIKTITNHHPVGKGATWGLFWGFLFGLLFFIPFFGLAIGAGVGALIGHVSKAGVDEAFQNQVREMLKPGTSALFMVVEQMTADKAMDALSKYGRHRPQDLPLQGGREATARRAAWRAAELGSADEQDELRRSCPRSCGDTDLQEERVGVGRPHYRPI
jgi:uncharacterized membrane protein